MEVLSHTKGGDHVPTVQLPPISSFDSLIRAASVSSSGSISRPETHSNAHTSMLLACANGLNYNSQHRRTSAGTDSVLPYYGQIASGVAGNYNGSDKGGVGTGSTTPTYRSSSVSQYGSSSSYGSTSPVQQIGMTMPMSVSGLPMRMDGLAHCSDRDSMKEKPHRVCVERSVSALAEARIHLKLGNRDNGAVAPEMVKKHPRKKKQCPICGLFFSNLSTHKSTHLSPETRPFRCEVCSRGFARSNDLIRHKKLHWKDDLNQETMDFVEKLKCLHQLKGTYKCPFNSNLIDLDVDLKGSMIKTGELPFETSNCHSTGVFSRCDTFKNHLKALHFEYPPGTKKKDRGKVGGRCKHCGQKFANLDVWLKEHVGKECGYNFSG